MSNPLTRNTPPRGFVSLESAAELLWQDESDPDPRWGIAFLKLAAETQGFTGTGKNADIRLDWLSTADGSPTHVRASQVLRLRPFFLKWCGLPLPVDEAKSIPKRGRGRPKGSTMASDDALVDVAIGLFRTGQAKSRTHAAQIVASRAQGASGEANYHRLRKKVVAACALRLPKRKN
jgi:hypothetical protein